MRTGKTPTAIITFSITLVAFSLPVATPGTTFDINLQSGAALAQSSEPAERPKRMQDPDSYYKAPNSIEGKTVLLPIGTTFEGRIDQTISSEHSHRGTRFNLVVDSPVLLNGTDVIIPSGSKIIGEVVEAVPAAAVPKQLMQDKRLIHGKLRVQINGLRTPDGSTYPMMAQLQGEVIDKMHAYMNLYKNPNGTSVGYIGTAAGFEAANANRVNADNMRNQRRGMGPQVMSKKEFLKDEMLGTGIERVEPDFTTMRSLVLKKRDYYIYDGSPLTVKVTAPFKIGISEPGQGVRVGTVEEPRDTQFPPPSPRSGNGGNDFSAHSSMQQMQQQQQMPPAQTRGPNPADSF